MGKTCSSYEGEKVNINLWEENITERDQLQDLGKKQDNIKLHLKEMGHEDFNGPGQDLIVGFWDDDEPSGFTVVGNFSVCWITISY